MPQTKSGTYYLSRIIKSPGLLDNKKIADALKNPAALAKSKAVPEIQRFRSIIAFVAEAKFMTDQPQTAVILGGGFLHDGSLTTLSTQRLDAGAELFRQGVVPSLTVLGALKRSYLPNVADYARPGAESRAAYLVSLGIPESAVNKILEGRDTIGEFLGLRGNLPKLGVHGFVLVTSEIDMPRSLWLAEAILGSGYSVQPHPVSSAGLLIAEEDAAYLKATQDYFAAHPGVLDRDEDWHASNPDLYNRFKEIHDQFHPPGKESQAYYAVARVTEKK